MIRISAVFKVVALIIYSNVTVAISTDKVKIINHTKGL